MPKKPIEKPARGAPLKSPELGPRIPWTARLPVSTIEKLRSHATPERSQADIVIEAVAQWSAARNKEA